MLLRLVVFLCGGIVMVLQLTGSRVMAPYFGSSTFIWTSLIGIILGSLSVGYWWGGIIADRGASFKGLAKIICAAGACVFAISILKVPVLAMLAGMVSDVRLAAVLGTTLLFSAPGILLGMVSPYAVKLKLHDLGETGSTVGGLYALSTAGSITGTFVAGFILISTFGTTQLLVLLAATLCLVAIIAAFAGK